jgi:hypothetical protein
LGNPPRPEDDPSFSNVLFGTIPDSVLAELHIFPKVINSVEIKNKNTHLKFILD